MEGLDALAMLLMECSPGDATNRRAAYWDSTVKITTIPERCSDDRQRYQGSGLLLTTDGYFVTNLHVLDAKQATIEFHGGLLGENVYATSLEKRLIKLERYDLILGKCTIPEAAKEHIVPPVLADKTPGLKDEVRVYGFKHEVVEERVGKVLGQHGRMRLCADGSIVTQSYRVFSKSGSGASLMDNAPEVSWFSDARVEQGFSGGAVVHAALGTLMGITVTKLEMTSFLGTVYEHGYIAVDGLRKLLSIYLRTLGFAIPR
jgi:S1-C subfamily serine protease